LDRAAQPADNNPKECISATSMFGSEATMQLKQLLQTGLPNMDEVKKQFGPYRCIYPIDQDRNKKQFNLTSKSLLNKKQVMHYLPYLAGNRYMSPIILFKQHNSKELL